MRKIFSVSLVLIMLFTLSACGNNSGANNTKGPTVRDLYVATNKIQGAYFCINLVSEKQLEKWSGAVNKNLIALFDAHYRSQHSSGEYCYKKRSDAIADLRGAKELLGTGGSGAYYEAVKEYYMQVSAYLNLVSTNPVGYSQTTYGQAVNTCKQKCLDAYETVMFYRPALEDI